MDYKLMQRHVDSCYSGDTPVLAEDGKNIKDFFCADVVGNRRFAQNYGGYPRSDIAEINSQSSLEQAKSLFNDLIVYPVSNDTAGLSDAEIMLSHRSKYCQAPSEQIAYFERQLELKAIRERESNPPKENVIDFSNNENPSVNE